MAGIAKKIQWGLLLSVFLFFASFMKVEAETQTGDFYGAQYTYNTSTGHLDLTGGYFTGIKRMFSNTAYNFGSPFVDQFPNVRAIKFSNVTFAPRSCEGLFSELMYLARVEFSNCDTSQVTGMQQMFNYCPSLGYVDLGGIESTSVSDYTRMFSYCGNLKTLNLRSLTISSWATVEDMFVGTNLENITVPMRMDAKVSLGASYVDGSGNVYTEMNSTNAGKSLVKGTGIINEPLSGWVSVNGEAVVGATLTVGMKTNNTGTLKYQWMRDNEPIKGATGSTYVVQNADVDHYISVVISSTFETGSLTSNQIGKIVATTMPTVKIYVSAPEAGQTPSNATIGEGACNVESTTWNPSDRVFVANKVYTVTIKVVTTSGSYFGANTKFYVNGEAIQPSYISDGSATVTVTYGKTANQSYPVRVTRAKATNERGESIDQAEVGSTVNVVADDPSKGMGFDKWQVSGVNIPNLTSSGISFVMPAKSVSLIATYKKCDHTGSEWKATCSSTAVCTICKDIIPKMDHDFSGQWVYDTDGHWHVCKSCGEKQTLQAHMPGAKATETTPQLCLVCGYVIQPALSHKTHNLRKVNAQAATCTTAGNKEYYKCDECGKMFSDQKGTNEVTLSQVLIKAAHTYNKYSSDSQFHWKECSVCHEQSTKVKHTYDLIIDADCNDCGYHRNVGAYKQMKFKDVKSNGWYKDYVQYVYNYGIMNGQADTLFGTDANITREEFVQVLYNMEGKPDVSFKKIFTDVNEKDWYADAVIWARDNDIVAGYDDGTFGVKKPITREQIAQILYKYATYKKFDTKYDSKITQNAIYKDRGKISDWANKAMNWAVTKKILNGKPAKDGKNYELAPLGNATRAEAATMIVNMLENLYSKK